MAPAAGYILMRRTVVAASSQHVNQLIIPPARVAISVWHGPEPDMAETDPSKRYGVYKKKSEANNRMVMLRLTAEQYRKLPILVDEKTCIGKTYIITGGNSGLGLETARHLVSASAERVVLAVRNLKAGEAAKNDIEKTTGRKGVVEVRHIDMSTYASVQSFVKKITEELDRIDGFVCNAGLMIDAWSQSEGMETSMFVNVVNTVFLGALMMPKLKDSAIKFSIKPTLVFIVSVFGYTAKGEMDKSRNGVIFEGLNDQKRANMDSSALYASLQHSAQPSVQRVITMVAPGLCSTGLGRDTRTLTKIMHEAVRAMMARTAEVGSRTILHGLLVGEDGHGKLLSGCKIKEFWVPTWLTDPEGQMLQKGIWDELVLKLESVQPGCIAMLK
ncbi:conserved hypothetical protein [Histoplasma capsulatum H143]|uniref:Short-chain dehydrogenase/reductase n=1 Tax=Ajellomyces capsulatus (strain H143) TaxID=544712 RepID=C6HMQ1_AJECH|nr:conserved hypothetical protein [Histoplasma capsulatum H143]